MESIQLDVKMTIFLSKDIEMIRINQTSVKKEKKTKKRFNFNLVEFFESERTESIELDVKLKRNDFNPPFPPLLFFDWSTVQYQSKAMELTGHVKLVTKTWLSTEIITIIESKKD